MFAKFCHLSVIHLTVTTVYFHPGVSVSLQTTSCYVLIKVFAKRVERGETSVTPDWGCGQTRSDPGIIENVSPCIESGESHILTILN